MNHSTEFLPRVPRAPAGRDGKKKRGDSLESSRGMIRGVGGKRAEQRGGAAGGVGARKAICETSLRFLVSTRRRLIGAPSEFLQRVNVEISEEEDEAEKKR